MGKSSLENLALLTLAGDTKITVEGLKHLQGLKRLTYLQVANKDKIGADGLDKLKTALPQLEEIIVVHSDASGNIVRVDRR